MLSQSDSREIATARLRELEASADTALAIVEAHTIERPFVWVFFYNSREFVETANPAAALAGNAPLIVDRRTRMVHETGTAYPIEHYIAAFERNLGAP